MENEKKHLITIREKRTDTTTETEKTVEPLLDGRGQMLKDDFNNYVFIIKPDGITFTIPAINFLMEDGSPRSSEAEEDSDEEVHCWFILVSFIVKFKLILRCRKCANFLFHWLQFMMNEWDIWTREKNSQFYSIKCVLSYNSKTMPKRKCTFNQELQSKFPEFKKGKYDWEILCEICDSKISIANKGVTDINEHLCTQKHKNNLKSRSGTTTVLEKYIIKASNNNNIRAAEGALAFHTAIHHMSFNSLDCTNLLNKEIFAESVVAQNLTCNRTKATAIINNVLAPLSTTEFLNELKNIKFISVSTDASNHGNMKLFPILVQYFDETSSGITSKLLEIERADNETSDTICSLIINQLNRHNIMSKCVAFSGDNCNTNFGGKQRNGTNNVFSKLKSLSKNDIVGVGCSAHIINNAIQHGCDRLPIDIESITLKIYNYFSIYTIRVEALKDFCTDADVQYRQLLYHSRTRWLTLFPAVQRILQLYVPLKNYFESLEKPPTVIKGFFENELSELYMFLIHSTMNIFHTQIEKLEKSDNSIIETKKILSSILNNLDDRINDKFLPIKITTTIRKFTDIEMKENFVKNVLDFYKEIKNYLQDWITPMNEFAQFEWMDLSMITEKTEWSSLQRCILYLQSKNIDLDDSKLFDEWVHLKAFSQNLCDEDRVTLNVNNLWLKFFKTVNPSQYSELTKIAQYFFCIPAHNASVERVFSLITSQWTKERNALDLNTVSSLLKVKYNFKNVNCSQFYNYLLKKKDVLDAIGRKDKYNKDC